MDMSATAAPHSDLRTAERDALTDACTGGPRHLAPRSDLLAERVPALFTALPNVAIRRESHVQLGYDETSGEYHLSITAPVRTVTA